MSVKRILYVEINSDGTIGGSHHCLYELVKYIDRERYLPAVMFFQQNALVPDFKKVCDVYIWSADSGFVIERDFPRIYESLKKVAIFKMAVLFYQRIHNFFGYYIPNMVDIRRFLKTHNIDMVHGNNSPDLTDWLIMSKSLRIKMVSHLRFPWGPTKIKKYLIGYYDKIISISNYVTDQLILKDIPTDNVVTIHDGIDIDLIENKEKFSGGALKEYDIPTNAPVIGVIGNIRRWKGQHVAIESMKYLMDKQKHIRCVIVGEISNSEQDVEYIKYLKELTSTYGLENNIIFTGYRKDVLNILSEIDILVHTSIFPEPLGRVILEGMVFRKPVIATNHGGPVETIEDGISGFLVEPGNPKILAERISFLLENKEIAKRVAENARKRVEEKFNINKNVKDIERIYGKVLEKSKENI